MCIFNKLQFCCLWLNPSELKQTLSIHEPYPLFPSRTHVFAKKAPSPCFFLKGLEENFFARAKLYSLCRSIDNSRSIPLSYLPTILEFPGQSQKLTLRPTVPETFKIVLEIVYVVSALILYY